MFVFPSGTCSLLINFIVDGSYSSSNYWYLINHIDILLPTQTEENIYKYICDVVAPVFRNNWHFKLLLNYKFHVELDDDDKKALNFARKVAKRLDDDKQVANITYRYGNGYRDLKKTTVVFEFQF